MSFADSLRQDTKKKEMEDFVFARTLERCHSKLRSYCEIHSGEGKAEGYLLGAIQGIGSFCEESWPEIYSSQYETGSSLIRMGSRKWLDDLYKGKVETWRVAYHNVGAGEFINSAYMKRQRLSGVVGMTVPAGDPGKDFPLGCDGYKFAPNYIIRPMCTDPLVFCHRLADEIGKLLVADGFFHISVAVENCYDNYDVIRQDGRGDRCWTERVIGGKLVGYAIKFHVEW